MSSLYFYNIIEKLLLFIEKLCPDLIWTRSFNQNLWSNTELHPSLCVEYGPKLSPCVQVLLLCLLLFLLDELQQFLEEVKVLGYQDKPPYERLRSILQAGLRSLQSRDDGRLDFTAASGSSTSRVQVWSLIPRY